jgi:two-component system, chemotaxis family, protein-glutamate methylesterase/glutaminase
VGALGKLLGDLPSQFPAAILIVQHIDRHHPSMLADILARRAALPVKQAAEGDVLYPGTVYVAPPDRHMLVTPDRALSLSAAELVHFVRPSADLLFESLAAAYREQSIAVVLTGTGRDGAAGVIAIKKTGGTVIAQDKASSEFSGMPEAAVNTGQVDIVLDLDLIASKLLELVEVGTP